MSRAATSHAAVVLAAGGSSRLGRPKQLLQCDGETLVHRAVRLAMLTRPRRMLLVTGAESEAVAAAVGGVAVEEVHNREWAQGLASSVQCAATALHGFDGPVLLLACDQPALEFEHLRALLHHATSGKADCAATLHGDALGIPVVVPAAMLAQASELHGDRGLGGHLTRMARTDVWRLDAPELMLDIDDEADVTAAVMRGLLDP
jgi:molybdenum cofactor cytidylyltransferase